jgi:hypothetical protein
MFVLIPICISLIVTLVIFLSPVWPVTKDIEWREREQNIKKTIVFLVATVTLTSFISLLMWGCGTAKVWDYEVWNYKIVKVTHEERWSVEESRTREVPDGTDKDGNTTYRTETYYVTEYYGPYWKAIDEYGSANSIDAATYQHWIRVWANEKKIGEHRGSAAGFDTPITGGIFDANWTVDFARIYPWSAIRRYKNKVRYSHSVLKLQEPTKALLKQYPRPADQGNPTPVLAYGGKSFDDAEIDLLRRTNAEMGPKWLVHSILVTFAGDVSRAVVDDILIAWQNPNKNELVTFIAIGASNQVKWCEVHSWMDNTTIHAVLRDELMLQPFTVKGYSDLLLKHCPKLWHKKSFKDFDYLRVEVNYGWKVASLILSIIAVIGAFFVIEANVDKFPDFRRY